MEKHIQLHKLYTYTNKDLIEVTPNEILVYVYAKAELSKDLEELKKYPRSAVMPFPIVIEVRFPIAAEFEYNEYLLASAEAFAQVAAISPDFFNIFGTKKGVNITDLLLVASQELVVKFSDFENVDISSSCKQSLSLSSVYFYGAATRLVKEGENDWVEPILSGKEEPYAIYNTSMRSIFNLFCIENEHGKFFVTRLAIEDFLSLPHRYKGPEAVTRPFKAVRGVFGQTFKEPIPGSPLSPREEFNTRGLRNKVLLAPGIWRLRLVLVEEEIFGETIYVVTGMPPFMSKEDLDIHFDNKTDHFTNSKAIRDFIRNKQKTAATGVLG